MELLKKLAASERRVSALWRQVAQLEGEKEELELACSELEMDRAEMLELRERVAFLEREQGLESHSDDEDEWDRGCYPSGSERDYDSETL